MRRIVGLFAIGALVFGTAGCTVPSNGITGITIDATGNLVVVLAWCGRQPDAVIVYHDRSAEGAAAPSEYEPSSGGSSIEDAVYVAPRIEGGIASFRLDAPDSGWEAVLKPSAFDSTITYSAYGATNDNSYSTRHVRFRIGDAEELKRRPGTVLDNRYDLQTGEESNVFVPRAEFDRQGQKESCLE
ncbi:hypothetical protein ABT061_36005 [Streptosporangium sp. NPDC002544]|uniref:hypothetical protein n=1 Tax=Streptosporangium sp. NPDC002544 TaxID=3154538 RepID=UPI003324E0FF